MNKFYLLVSTIRYLRLSQIFFRIYYLIRSKIRGIVNFKYTITVKNITCNQIDLQEGIPYPAINFKLDVFEFLNIKHSFPDDIDWNYGAYGKLWTYNLNYFDFLNSVDRVEDGVRLIQNYLISDSDRKIGLEPYPTSLRGVNWIKFLSYHGIDNHHINKDLFRQYEILLNNIEYHLLGNHILENGFSLLFGGYYFREDKFYNKGIDIIVKELDEQILPDGAHFELSPMYHQIMLHRVLDSINLITNNTWKGEKNLQIFINLNLGEVAHMKL